MVGKRRGRVAATPRSGSAPQLADPLVPTIELDDQQVMELTATILQLHGTSGKRAVAARAEMGRLLLQVRHRLQRGQWRSWLERHLPFTSRTAERAILLRRLKVTDPARFARLAPLGISKVNVLLTLPPQLVDPLLDGRQRVPSSGAYKTVLAMTFAELMDVLAALDSAPEDGADFLVRTYRRQIRALIRTVDALIEDRDAIAEDDLADLYDDLLDASTRLGAAFHLDD